MADCARKVAPGGAAGDYDRVKEQLRGLGAALEQMTAAESAEALKLARQEAQKLLAEADALVERLGDVRAAAIAGRSDLEKRIRAQPLLAVGLAATAGFLLASLLRRGAS